MPSNPLIDRLKNRKSGDSRTVLIGQCPSGNEPSDPLSPDNPTWSGARLARMAGLSPDEFREKFFRINILYMRAPSFKVNEITRTAAREIYAGLRPGDHVILLGTAVMKCFLGLLPPMVDSDFEPVKRTGSKMGIYFYMVPQPSGLNRIYNDPTNVRLVGEFLRRAINREA